MIKKYLHRIFLVLLTACPVLLATGCRESMENISSDEDIEVGEDVMFTASLQTDAVTRSVEGYSFPQENYQLTIGMYTDSVTKVDEGVYNTIAGDEVGTLSAETPLYWHSTVTAYGFKATAGTADLEADQSTEEKWLLQDRLEGDAGGYRTAKEWKAYNKAAQLVSNEEDYKKILLKMQHKRSLISIILKAGEGVSRKALAYAVADNDLSARIYSYGTNGEPLEVTPLTREELISYEADTNGAAADSVSTTRYDAIVEPYDYTNQPTTDLITYISLSGQHYSFYAANDALFDDPDNPNNASYNLEAGKHLVITVTLSRDSRKVLMSAFVEDWNEEVTTTICDDYGNAGEPIKISNRTELIEFLSSDEKNKAGNVALVTDNIDLQDWGAGYGLDFDLNCTLNLGGKTIISNYRFLNTLNDAATLQNGSIQIGGEVDAAVATANKGVIESIRVTVKDTAATVQATGAGVTVSNTGTISNCRSALMVSGGTDGYVGGIAATSLSTESKIAIIEGCTVTNRVDGGSLKGGGIVGKANGYINGNTFGYGITLNQDKDQYKNIVGEKDNSHATFKAEGNAWPTVDENPFDDASAIDNATAAADLYSGIIDSEEELVTSTTAAYNLDGYRYRLAKDITVSATAGDVNSELDGNSKTITTGAMIFNNVTGTVHDLTVYVNADLTATQDAEAATDAIAPLAFSVHGSTAVISDVRVKTADDVTITASNPAGVVVWAYDEAVISNCEVKVNLYANVNTSVTQGRKFAGGIVSTVSQATVTQCIMHSASTMKGTDATVIYYGGIVGGIEKKEGSGDTPELTVTDCTSFITLTKDQKHGGILGNALYGTDNDATSASCQGNWWQSDCNGVGTSYGSVESVIGKRNAVTPTEKSF